MIRRLILVRHGESEANRAGTFDGYGDAVLTDLGHRQAAATAAALARRALGPMALISSPLRRATQTAAAIGAALQLEASLHPELLAGEGQPAGVDLADPEVIAATGEAALMVVRTALLASPGGLIAVSHRYPLRALLSRIIGLDEAGAMVDALGNGDTVEMECHGEALLEDARLYRLGAP